jgi:glycosyltransferase involved in cell wall biosynthesis
MTSVAIVYHYLALYRFPIFGELMKSKDIEYNIFSGVSSEIEIKKVNTELATLSVDDGGLRWHFVDNKWMLKRKLLWQHHIIKQGLQSKFDSFIFLGSPYHLSTWITSLILRIKGKRVYFWMHGIYSDKLSLFDYFNLYTFYRIPNGFFLYGNRANIILKKYLPHKEMHVIYNSLNYDASVKLRKDVSVCEIELHREKFFINKKLPTVISIGRVNRVKRIDLLLQAQKLILNEGDKYMFNLMIVGDGEELNNIKMLANNLGLNQHIYFYGACYDEEINANLIQGADLCIIPGEIGLTSIHALSYGTPVISHDNLNVQMPEVEAIQVGVTGDLFKQGDATDLKDKIQQWLIRYPIKEASVMQKCYTIVDKYYNPQYQAKVFNSVLA